MNENDAAAKFRRIVSTILQVPEQQVADDLTPDKADTWDSLNHLNLIGALEEEFGVQFSAESLDNTQSVPRLKALLAEHGVEL